MLKYTRKQKVAMSKAFTSQVDGKHYTEQELQPLEMTYLRYGLEGLKAAIHTKVDKYITREKDDWVKQYTKAEHCISILIEMTKIEQECALDELNQAKADSAVVGEVDFYCSQCAGFHEFKDTGESLVCNSCGSFELKKEYFGVPNIPEPPKAPEPPETRIIKEDKPSFTAKATIAGTCKCIEPRWTYFDHSGLWRCEHCNMIKV